jgi:catecholate siderophore receptor
MPDRHDRHQRNLHQRINAQPFDAFTGPILKGPGNSQTATDWTTLSAYVFDTITLSDKFMVNLGGRYDRF